MISGDTAPSWPALIVADAALWFSRRLLAVAKRNRSRRRVALGAIWLSEQIAVLGRRMLTR